MSVAAERRAANQRRHAEPHEPDKVPEPCPDRQRKKRKKSRLCDFIKANTATAGSSRQCVKKPIGDSFLGIFILEAQSLLLRRYYKCHSPLVGCKLVDIEIFSLPAGVFTNIFHLRTLPSHLISSSHLSSLYPTSSHSEMSSSASTDLRVLTRKLTSIPPAQLPHSLPSLIRHVLRCRDALSAPQDPKAKGDASQTTMLVHKLKTSITTHLNGRSREGRFAAIGLIKAAVDVGGWETLRGSEAWVRGLLSIVQVRTHIFLNLICHDGLQKANTCFRKPTLRRPKN